MITGQLGVGTRIPDLQLKVVSPYTSSDTDCHGHRGNNPSLLLDTFFCTSSAADYIIIDLGSVYHVTKVIFSHVVSYIPFCVYILL